MKELSLRALQAYLGLVCAFHIVIGAGINSSRSFIERVAELYGAQVNLDNREFLTILHPLGAFMLILGVLAAVAAAQPIRYRAVGYSFAGLFVIRAVQRAVFKQDLEDAFRISSTHNLFNICLFLALGISLAALQWYAERQQGVRTA
jgi:hypothetical protein